MHYLLLFYPIYVACERVVVFEGDMLKYQETSVAGTLNSALADAKTRWQDGELVYSYDPDSKFTRSEKRQLEAAMVEIKENTCVQFREKEDDDEDYVLIIKPRRKDCKSFVGRQARSDRDKYITVVWENMSPDFKENYKKRNESELTLLDTPYSYNSVMHYSGMDSSSINGKPVMVPKKPGVTLGPLKNKLSDIDILRINRLYHCGNTAEATSTSLPTTRTPQARGEVWRGVGVSWAPLCDFAGYDIEKVLGPGEECGGHCQMHYQCTHFTWSKIGGGTCFLKAGFDTGARPYCLDPAVWDGAVCGFMGSPREIGLSETVSCIPIEGR